MSAYLLIMRHSFTRYECLCALSRDNRKLWISLGYFEVKVIKHFYPVQQSSSWPKKKCLNSRHFPIRLDCSFSRIHYLSLEYQVELARCSFDTCPLSLFLWFITGFVYVPELHTRVIPLPCNTFSMTRQLNFAFSSCLVSRNN